MTDSMKFGPEWLRNMSMDSTNPTLGSSASSGILSNTNSSFSTASHINTSSQHNNFTMSAHMPATRNMFPEFRYGREEMLSLFDKNCNMPEILPLHKKIFVEKVQFPLALTPSTDEEMVTQGPVVLPVTQRPAWTQRSPIGFSSSSRGTGRGGSVDRGRMRGGKSVFHPIYQRPTPMFEDDLRTSLKSERSWSERNGSGDAVGNIGSDWNGTPSLSPRKEFSSHPRNMENWRRNRNEDGSGDAISGGGGLTGTDGWRGSSTNSFVNTNRWGRSTSWREEDISPANTDGYSGGNGVTMQRSYSTIATTVSERAGFVSNNMTKSSSNASSYPSNQSSNRAINSGNVVSCGHSLRNSQWASGGADGEDNLPEWAMENPSDSGGTFDASGAFHGSVHEDTPTHDNSKKEPFKYQSALRNSSITPPGNTKKKQPDNLVDNSFSPVKLIRHSNSASSEDIDKSLEPNDEISLQSVVTKTKTQQKILESGIEINNAFEKTNDSPTNSVANDTSNLQLPLSAAKHSSYFNEISVHSKNANEPPHSDFSDHMKEVADDMVQKLIMDDDTVGINECSDVNGKSNNVVLAAASDESGVEKAFVSSGVTLKQSIAAPHHQSIQNSVSVSPTLPSLSGVSGHKGIQLYGGGVVVDHATMQQHHLQHQLAAATAVAAASLPQTLNVSEADMWYYRDPQSKVQGPFTAIEMTEWYRAGYFNENLYVRRVCETRFRALGELIKQCHGNMPFTHSHLISIANVVEGMQIPNVSSTMNQICEKTQQTALNDFEIKQQNEQREELKGHVTAAADSLSAAIKNLISSVDMTHMLHMHFQMLQKQYLRHQEMLILTKLSKNECFLRLTLPEQEAVVHQKVQQIGLPEYLTSLSGLSNSLATLNPTAGNQLYETIAECSKKYDMYPSGATQQQTFLNADDFILNSQQQQQLTSPSQYSSVGSYGAAVISGSEKTIHGGSDQLSGNDLINDFNMRMYLQSGANINVTTPQGPQAQDPQDFLGNTNSTDFLTEQHLLVAAAAQNPMMQVWMPPLGGVASHQQPQILTQPQNSQWVGGLLVGIPTSVIPGPQLGIDSGNVVQKTCMPTSIWNVPPLEQACEQQDLEQLGTVNFNDPQTTKIALELDQPKKKNFQPSLQKQLKEIDNVSELLKAEIPLTANQKPDVALSLGIPVVKQQRKVEQPLDKQNQHLGKKQHNKQPNMTSSANTSNNSRKNEEERRRELAEEKRRQKDDRKRQQLEEEKRRAQQVEEEKRRQLTEEKERMQQIQAQRRKAMLGGSASVSSVAVSSTTNLVATGIKSNKDQRLQSSVAPWSTQNIASAGNNGPGPCLAEIQKAERRERRADQQRQMEIQDKQVRAHAAAVSDTNEPMLKWNASPIPVKSFAEIQAEEAKRLATETLETQRRKELEQAALAAGSGLSGNMNAVGGSGTVVSGNPSVIWGGTNKVWGTTTTAGFWEEPIQFSAATIVTTNNSNITSCSYSVNSCVLNSSAGGGKTSQLSMHKLSNAATGHVVSSNRNLKKSQTVSVMQNTASTSALKNSKINNNQNNPSSIKQGANKLQQKNSEAEKRGGNNSAKHLNSNNSANKKDDFEYEFTGWCTKSLNNMNTQVDVPTFVTFLQDLESPYEVKDYVRMYLGENKEYTEFAKQFLERRSKYKNLQRAQNAHNDDMCKPAPAITPSGNDSSDKAKQKKVKKNKMTKLDARILGFSVTAAEGRINVGDRDYVDAP